MADQFQGTVDERASQVLAWLERRGSRRNREGMARYGITSPKTFGVSMATMRPVVRRLGRDHALANRLWESGWLEARIVAGFIADPSMLTPRQMDRWVRDLDNWAVTDSTCLHAFCYSRYGWGRVKAWSRRRGEYQRRAAFALLAALAVHDRDAADATFMATAPTLLSGARDERPYVRKAVNWALRQIGKRNLRLLAWASRVARDIAALGTPAARWIASDALRELQSPAVRARLRSRTRRRR